MAFDIPMFDGLGSMVSSMAGFSGDASAAQIGASHRVPWYTYLYKSDWVAAKIVDVPANDATRAWRQWQTDADKITKLENEENRLRVRDTVRRALKSARMHGGSAIIIHDGTPADQMDQPFDPKKVKRGGLQALIVVGRNELKPELKGEAGYVNEPGHHYQMPELWNYQPVKSRGIQERQVHHSRIVFIPATDAIAGDTTEEWWWTDSVLCSVEDDIHNARKARESAAHLVKNANNDVLSIDNLSGKLGSSDGEAAVVKYGGLINRTKSSMNMTIIDKNDDYSREAYSFTGLTDTVLMEHQLLAAAADMPITRMLGTSPGGMNATGEHDMGNYRNMLGGIQESILSPAMAELDIAVIRSALGSAPKALWYEWRTPDLRSEKEKVENAEKRAKTFETWTRTGVVPSEVMEGIAEATLTEHGDLPGAEQSFLEWREAGEPEPEPEPEPAPEPEPTE